jgi:V8-like Glu-specific endopeptidase
MEVSDTTITYDIDTIGGNSGCPCYLVQDGNAIVVCVHTTGGIISNSGTRIRSDVYENLKKWKAEDDT